MVLETFVSISLLLDGCNMAMGHKCHNGFEKPSQLLSSPVGNMHVYCLPLLCGAYAYSAQNASNVRAMVHPDLCQSALHAEACYGLVPNQALGVSAEPDSNLRQ
jgi:hypothetical protein